MTALLEQDATRLHTRLIEEHAARRIGEQDGIEYLLENAYTYLIFELADGRSERFSLAPLVDMEYTIYAPVSHHNGGLVVPLEVKRFENSAVSKVLWPGERLTVKGGVRTHPDARPIYGSVHIQPGRDVQSGVLDRQTLWSRFWTPIGELTMGYPVNMSGVVTTLQPPLKARLYADQPIPLFNAEDEHVATIYDCTTAD
jgi:hypothetical protein